MKRVLFIGFNFIVFLSFAQSKSQWVDSVFSTMTLKEKVEQLFMVPVNLEGQQDQSNPNKLIIQKYSPGLVSIIGNYSESHISYLNELQKRSKLPLLVGINQRAFQSPLVKPSFFNYQQPMFVGANTDTEKLKALGKISATQFRNIGVHVNILNAGERQPLYFQGTSSERIQNQTRAFLEGIRNGGGVPMMKLFVNVNDEVSGDPISFANIEILSLNTKKKNGVPERIAFVAGNDVLIYPNNIKKGIKRIEKVVKQDESRLKQLDNSVIKILSAKYDAGLNRKRTVDPNGLQEKLLTSETILIDEQLKQGAVTLLRNTTGLLPIKQLETKKFKLVSIGPSSELQLRLDRFVPFEKIPLATVSDTTNVEKQLSNAIVVVSLNAETPELYKWIKRMANQYQVVVCHFGNPHDLTFFNAIPVLIEGYDEVAIGSKVAEAIFGAIPTEGSLPIEVKNTFQEGTKNNLEVINRVSYSVPEDAAIDSKILTKVDEIVQEALNIQAAPGARVMIARKGKVIYDKSFGYQSSEKKIPVNENTIYDLASVTKITATLQAVMFMYERGLIDINKKISIYLPEFKETNKKDIIIKDILTHQAGLWPYFAWHLNLLKDSAQMAYFFSDKSSEDYPYPVSENLFSHKSMRDSMWSWIVKSKMIEKKDRTPYEYRYSDLGLYIMQRLAEKILNQPIEDFVWQNFYEPMGATTTGYHPLERFSPERIAATENDTVFRKSLLTGYVHDPGSAMFGGVAGHAGLFSNANDLLKMGQMWLQKGSYGGTQYFKPETIDLFTARTYATSRRGLGWDKPTGDDKGSTGLLCSPLTFGHTGFTGTCIWVDSQYELVYVFLSNRVNPDISPKLASANIRNRIQDTIYEAIKSYEAKK